MNRLKSLLKKIPVFQFLYKQYVIISGKMRYWKHKIMRKVYDDEDLITMFGQIGISPKDKIVLNLSMSRIGVLKNGPETFVNALKKYITKEGLIVMPTYPHRASYEYLNNYTIFDVQKTPSKNGAVTEYFRTSENVYRSIHPTHPLAAWGDGAKELMSGHEFSKSMYDEKSPYKKLLDINVKNVLIGVNFDHMIMIRIIDDLLPEYPINPYLDQKFYVKVCGYNGELIEMETNCHDPNYFGQNRDNMKLFPYLKDKITFGNLGGAQTMVMYSQDMFTKQVECARNGIFPFKIYRFKKK